MKHRLRAMVLLLGMLAVVGPARPFNSGLIGTPSALAQAAVCGGSFPVVADAAVSRSNPAIAHGTERLLRVAAGRSGAWHTLLRFDFVGRIPAGAAIQSAELELTLNGTPAPLPYSIAVHSVDGRWAEATITWNTQPAPAAGYGDESSLASSGTLKLDVTALATQWVTGDVAATELLLLPALPEMDVAFSSRESIPAGIPEPRLVIRCALPVTAQPGDQTAADQRQQADFTRLKQATTRPLEAQLERGVLRSALFDLAVPSNAGTDALSRALWFLNEYRGLLRLSEPAQQLQLKRRSGDGRHLFFRQQHNGIPVWPAEIGIHLDGARILALSGDYLPEITLPSTPRLTAEQAEALAVALGGPDTKTLGGPDTRVAGDTQLRYVNLGLLGGPDTRTRLAWQVNLGQTVAGEALLIDANSGELIIRLDRTMSDLDLDLETANNTGQSDTCWAFTYDDDQWFDEDGVVGGANPDAEGFQAFNNVKSLYNFWNGTFGRDSYDDDGEDIAMYIHVNPHPGTASYSPGCDIFEFGNTNITPDLMGHEFSHAVDSSEGELEYVFQSGALDESFADIFGHAMDPGDWTIGDGSAQGAFRNMSNPPAFGDPDRMSNWFVTLADSGGVHTNSGIHNKAAFLLTDGGTFNGRIVSGIGQSKAQQLFYNVLTGWVGGNSKFQDARNGMVFYALTTYGAQSKELCAVRNAYAAVEIGQGDANCDGVEDGSQPDNDGDQTPDGGDNCPNIANWSQGDIDKDGQGDACDNDIDNDGDPNAADNCQYTPNANQANNYGGPAGDACEDSDKDTVTDLIDNCPTTGNILQENSDNDGQGDACDSDIDNDGDPNTADNCVDTPNFNQQDSDGDGVGDACDLCPGVKSSNNADPDGDGLGNPCDGDDDGDDVLDHADNCPLDYNPTQFDFNMDGKGYACDPHEQNILAISETYVYSALLPLILPVPDCIRCGREYLPQGYEQIINIALPVGFTARVVDSAGLTVAKSTLSGTQHTLSFAPQPYTNQANQNQAGSASQAVATQVERDIAANDTGYRLQIVPADGVDPAQKYPIKVEISDKQASNTIFVPSVSAGAR